MSLLRLGINPDGTRHTLDVGPARARPAGNGGQALGSIFAPTVVKPQPRHSPPLREKDQRRKERRENPICGALMGWRNQYDSAPIPGLVCFRAPDHKGCHRSAQVMETDRERRRTFRRPRLHKDVA